MCGLAALSPIPEARIRARCRLVAVGVSAGGAGGAGGAGSAGSECSAASAPRSSIVATAVTAAAWRPLGSDATPASIAARASESA
eukprot:166139-Prymnesium_polylepis.1